MLCIYNIFYVRIVQSLYFAGQIKAGFLFGDAASLFKSDIVLFYLLQCKH